MTAAGTAYPVADQARWRPGEGLRAELLAIEAAHRRWHWHLFLSSEGRVWAVSPHNTCGGSGTTVDGSTPGIVGREIANVEHLWEMAA